LRIVFENYFKGCFFSFAVIDCHLASLSFVVIGLRRHLLSFRYAVIDCHLATLSLIVI